MLTTPPAATTSSPSDNAGEGCEGVCAAVAAASGLEPAALDPAAWRTLEWLRQQAPQLAASVGPAPLTVLAAAPLEAAGEAGARRGSEGGGGSNAVAGIGEVVGLNPLHVALALAFARAFSLAFSLTFATALPDGRFLGGIPMIHTFLYDRIGKFLLYYTKRGVIRN